MNQVDHLIAWALAMLGSAFFGSYFGAYLKKKGENLATQEDIAKLVEQVRAVTAATKEIEAKISNKVWDRQRLWELKRDLLLEATRRLGVCMDASANVNAVYQADREQILKGEPGRIDKRIEKAEAWIIASVAQINTTTTAPVAFGATISSVQDALTLPPADHWDLEYWSCTPSSCTDDEGPTTDGAAQASGTGLCYDGVQVQVSAYSFVVSCSSPYLLSATVVPWRTTLTAFHKTYSLDALRATTAVFDGADVLVSTAYYMEFCTGVINQSSPVEEPC